MSKVKVIIIVNGVLQRKHYAVMDQYEIADLDDIIDKTIREQQNAKTDEIRKSR